MLELLAFEYRGAIQDLLAFAIFLAALKWGSAPERAVILVWIVLFEVIDGLYHLVSNAGYTLTDVDLWHASLDGLAGVIWIAIALFANRNYPLWIAAMQLLALMAHAARGLTDSISPVAYISMAVAPGWLQLLFMAVGLFRHARRKRQYGKYRDWRFSKQLFEMRSAIPQRDVDSGMVVGNVAARDKQ